MAADLQFRIGAELSEIKGALASLRRDFASVGQAADQAGGGRSLRGLEGGADSAATSVRRLVTAFVSVAAAIKLIGAADELNTLNARIRLVTNSTEEYNRAQVALFDLAQRTRGSLGETINLYTRIAQATKDAGVGQETLLQVVETINQAVQLSGASTQAAEAALIQLGQGLASGTLRGEELNSILEQTPALADAIAKGIGITRGELRQYGQDGKLSAEQVIKALQAQRDVVAKQFAELPLTVGQSMTLLKNAGLQLLGAFNDTSGATSGLASSIKDLADFLSSDAALGAVIEFAATWSGAFDLIVSDIKGAVGIINDATGDIVGTGEDLIALLGRAFRELPINIRASVQLLVVNIASAFDQVIARAEFLRDVLAAVFTDDTIDAAGARLERRLSSIGQAAQGAIDDILADRQRVINDAAATREASQQRRTQARQAPTDQGSRSLGNFRTRETDEQRRGANAQRKAELDAEERLTKDSTERAKTFYADLYRDAKLSAADYYATRQALELSALDQAIATEQRRAAAGGTDRTKALAEIEILEREKASVKDRIARERENDEQKLAKELAQVQARTLENQGRTADARRIQLEAQFRETLARLQAEGNTEGVKLIERLINADVARAQFDEIKRDFDRTVSDLQARQQAIGAQVSTGAVSADTGQQQSRVAREEALTQMDALNVKVQELAQATNDPAILQGAEQITATMNNMAIDSATGIDAAIISLRSSLANLQQSFAQTVAGAGVDAITGLFTDLASGSKSAGDALKDFVKGFVASMAQIAARALATFLVLQLLDAIYPGLGKATSAGMSAGVKHAGGMVGGPGVTRRVDPLIFAGAPRFHNGGMVGLKPGEVPAILQTGEEVLARNDPRNAANGGASGNGYRIVNVLDPSLVSGYLESSAGERAVLNVISRNQGQVRQVIGA